MSNAVQIFDPISVKGTHRFAKIDSQGNLKVGFNDQNGFTLNFGQPNVDNASSAQIIVPVQTYPTVYNGSGYDLMRTPNVFKHLLATNAGNTGIWTPAGGKKFRLMRFFVEIGGFTTLGAAGNEQITFQDANSTINGIMFNTQVNNAATIGTYFSSGWVDLGNGFLSAAANQILSVNLGASTIQGGVTVMVAGTEEF